QILDGHSGAVVDEVTQPLGLRFYRIDPDQGFFLNGEYLDLHGVSFLQDRLNKGWAISDADQVEDMSFVWEIGATYARLSHFQHPALIHDLLDASGIVASTEIPLIDSVEADPAYFENAKQQLRELIRQNYNHPAIFFWGLYNEIPDNPASEQLVSEL